jgi:ABC-type arginine/histidine transport system permease subunit
MEDPMSSTFPNLSTGVKISLALVVLGLIIGILAAIGLMDKMAEMDRKAESEEATPAVVPAAE